MTDFELDEDEAPDAFATTEECWAYQRVPVPIGWPTHTHVCRRTINDLGVHDGRHRCGCNGGTDF